MTTKVKRVLAELASMSGDELEELERSCREAADPELVAFWDRMARLGPGNTNSFPDGRRPAFKTADLARLLKDLPPDPSFADDIEAGVRARREADEARTSPWDS